MFLTYHLAFVLFIVPTANAFFSRHNFTFELHGSKGVNAWDRLPGFGDCSKDNWQSPIDIDSGKAKPKDGKIHFNGYDVPLTSLRLINWKNTVRINFDNLSSPKPTIEGGDLPGQYELLQIHLHWGKQDSFGTEHTIDGESAPCEIHLVHGRIKGTETDPKDTNSLAVIGSICELADAENKDLTGFFNAADHLQPADIVHFPIEELILSSLLPNYGEGPFYRYFGSLTNPPCSRNVVWTVFEDTLKISRKQLESLRKVYQEWGNPIDVLGNFRPVHPLGNRTVWRYNNSEE